MRKSRLSIALMTSLLGVCALAGCDPVEYSPNGNLISYTIKNKDGSEEQYTISAEEIFVKYYNDSDKYQSIFDAIKSIVIRNYFTIEEEVTLPDNSKIKLGLSQLPELEAAANKSVSSDVHDATTRANTNKTTYDKEFESILKSKGVKTKEELYEKYLDEEKTNKFNENYYKYFLDEIKNGYDDGLEGTSELEKFWTGYFDNMLPYHVSHILVNVSDSSETNYYNGTINETDVEKLYTVVKMLVNENKTSDTFKSIAKLWSDDANGDESSKEYYGDLGVMTYAESYVNEFKLGIYAFENLFGNSAAAQTSNIDIPGIYDYETGETSEGLEAQFFDAVNKSYDNITVGKENAIPSVKLDVFEDLYKVKDLVKDTNGDEVMENSTLVYPRNIIYNKYLNRHSFAFVTGDEDTGDFGTATKPGDVNVYPNESATGIHTYTDDDGYPLLSGNKILSTVVAGQMRPILMVRAGGGNYQGIHFIVVNRDPFQVGEDNNGVNMEEYYHTYKLPTDASKTTYFPKENGVFKKTYANFATDEYGKVNSRIDSFTSKLKEFDSEKLSKFFFKKYAEKEGLKISDPELDAALTKWINTTVASKEEADIEAWETSWTDYIAALRKQNSERNSLMSEFCKVGFDKALNTAIANEAAFISLLGEYGITSGKEYDTLLGRYQAHSAEIKTIADLYNVKGAPCNDGNSHK